MNTFYLVLRVIPTPQNELINEVEGALASCWVCDDDQISASNLAAFKLRQLDWTVMRIEEAPVTVTEDDYRENETDFDRYKAAQIRGMSIEFTAWGKNGKIFRDPIKPKKSNDFVLDDYLSQIAELKQRGRCLHFEAGNRCSQPIEAHSIQKSGVLSLIARTGHVYSPSRNFSNTKRRRGGVVFTEQGINKVSTFRGFCGKHDKHIFAPIDDFLLAPTSEQITLYAYRCLCREVFVKENAVTLFQELMKRPSGNEANRAIVSSALQGSTLALKNLLRHKTNYELLLKSKSFASMKSVLFHSRQKPSVVFSGLLFPDYDFVGRPLQDLRNQSLERNLITFSFAPMSDGWAFLFAWHEDSSKTCVPLVRSLATQVSAGGNLGDFLFRFVVSSCENLAISPTWWEARSETQRVEIEQLAAYGIKISSPLRSNYLTQGVEGCSEWEFDRVVDDF